MKFIVTFVYMDGEKFELEVAEGDMEGFINAVGKSEVFFNNSAGIGIFIPIDKVRYFSVERVDGQGRRVVASDRKLPVCDGGVECGEKDDSIKRGEGVAGSVPALGRESVPVKAHDGREG